MTWQKIGLFAGACVVSVVATIFLLRFIMSGSF